MTTPTDRVRAALDQLINYAQDSNGNQYGSLCASLVEHIAQQALSELKGKVLVPVEPTDQDRSAALNEFDRMINADIGDTENSWMSEKSISVVRALLIAPYVKGGTE